MIKKDRGFACSCSPESRAEAEGWVREAFPKHELSLSTGKFKTETLTPSTRQDDGTWEPNPEEAKEFTWEEPRESSVAELAMLTIADLGKNLRVYFQIGIITDQWCALDVVGRPWDTMDDEETWESYGLQFDYDCLPHALCAVILQIEDNHPELKETDSQEKRAE